MAESKSLTSEPPSEDSLRLLIANGGADIAQQLIGAFKLQLRIENGELKDALVGSELHLKYFMTRDHDTLSIKDDVHKLAKCDDAILITGETGTGKELIAKAMRGDRQGMFVACNCAGFPEQLIESELFGYVKGAFTGADNTRQGLMATAKDGVLFLDEIGELALSVQAKLLRAIQDKQIRRVGGRDMEDINCKFVCATHRDIKKMVKNNEFRQDLYARISTFEVHIKSLRERECDIELIILSLQGGKEFLAELHKQGHGLHKLDLSLNVRSLQQYVRRYSVLGRIIL